MLDIFFLSYNEPFADENYSKLLAKAPLAKRVNGITGFYAAHRRCAELSMTNNFYVVDADAIIVDEFDFSFTPSKHNQIWGQAESDLMYVWSSINPINDLVYGYGGVKLIPKVPLIKSNDEGQIDFTTGTGIKIKVQDQVSNITAFNYDEFSTWRAAVRECVKLATNLTNSTLEKETTLSKEVIDKVYNDTEQRLNVWCNNGRDRLYGEYAIHGANYGKEYGMKHINNFQELSKINNLEWIKDEFNKFF